MVGSEDPAATRQEVARRFNVAADTTAALPDNVARFLLFKLDEFDQALDAAQRYRSFLRSHGGGDNSDWAEAGLDEDDAIAERGRLREHLSGFARGDLGPWRDAYDRWRSRLGVADLAATHKAT